MENHQDFLTPVRLGFVLLPRNCFVSFNERKFEFRGLDRFPGARFDSVLPDDPEILQEFASKALNDQNSLGFYQEIEQAHSICKDLNAILYILRKQDNDLGSFDPKYEVVGCNIEEIAIEDLQVEGVYLDNMAPADSLSMFLGYDVAYLSGAFSAIRHGLFGLTHYLNVFGSAINENGLFDSFSVARNFRDAYLDSSSKEIGAFYIHRLFLPIFNRIDNP